MKLRVVGGLITSPDNTSGLGKVECWGKNKVSR